MLTQYGTWHNISVDDLCYFDGEYAFYSPNYYSFCGVDRLGNRSEAWNNTGHGRAETAMIWNGKIVADLFADYWYTVFPLGFDKPARDSISKLECNDINE